MRGKRAKSYRRQMDAYVRAFSFREPYQVVVDSEFVRETKKCAMELESRVAQVLHGQVKPIITQCSMRHLYATARTSPPGLIDSAKAYERRRCGHHPSEYPDPLPEHECIAGVVGPANKHRYVVASQDEGLRRAMRDVLGVPLLHVRRSVMILEPIAQATVEGLERGERAKFRGGLRLKGGEKEDKKRKRDDEDGDEEMGGVGEEDGGGSGDEEEGGDDNADNDGDAPKAPKKPTLQKQQEAARKKKKRKYGVKGPNPLSVKKRKERS